MMYRVGGYADENSFLASTQSVGGLIDTYERSMPEPGDVEEQCRLLFGGSVSEVSVSQGS